MPSPPKPATRSAVPGGPYTGMGGRGPSGLYCRATQ